jgi:hypothetical protein
MKSASLFLLVAAVTYLGTMYAIAGIVAVVAAVLTGIAIVCKQSKLFFRAAFGVCLLGCLITAATWATASNALMPPMTKGTSIPGGHWVAHEEDAACYGYFVGGVQVAYYDSDLDLYRTYDAATEGFGPEQIPPWGRRMKAEPRDGFNFGNDYKKNAKPAGDEKPKYRIQGKPVSREEAVETIQTGKIPDDSGKLRVTVIGAQTERDRVSGDLMTSPSFKDLRADLVCKFYPANAWEVSKGFFTAGHPTIYGQYPDGKVFHRQDDYEGGAEALADAIRQADPNYDPAKDTDARSGTFSGILNAIKGESQSAGWGLGIFSILAVVLRRYA